MKFFLAIATVVCLGSCHYDNIVLPESAPVNTIVGRWNWTSTSGGMVPDRNPATEGYNMTLFLTSGLKYSMYTNSTITRQGSYKTETVADYSYLSFDTDAGLLITQPSADVLVLGTSAADGPAYHYNRIKN